LLAAAAASVLLCTPGARANGRLPAANKLLFAPGASGVVVLRTTFGVLISRDGGTTWDWLCEAALGIGSTQAIDPSLAITANGTIVAGVVDKLLSSSDMGCDWSAAGCPVAGPKLIDLTVRPDNAHVVLALASTAVSVGDGDAGGGSGADAGGCPSASIDAGVGDSGIGYLNQVYESTDDGAHWSALGTPLSSTAQPTTLEVAATDPHRIYVSAYREIGDQRDSILFVSLDDAATWTERLTPPFDPVTEAAAYIAAVDPTDANRVYLRTGGLGASRLFVTANAGATFDIPLTFSRQMLGFALSPDGSEVYAGGPADGIYAAARGAPSFQKVSPLGVLCLATDGADLWACSTEGPNGFIAGVSADQGATFTAKLHLNGIAAPLACSPQSTAAPCVPAFQQICQSFGCAGQSDGGTPAADAGEPGADASGAPDAATDATAGPRDSGADSGTVPPPGSPSKSSCGCAAVGSGGAAGLVAVTGALLATLLATAARRRARRRSASR
jgi:hypothetical protein